MLPPTPDLGSFLGSPTDTVSPPLPAEDIVDADPLRDSDSALNVPAWLRDEVNSMSGRSSRTTNKSRTPTPIGVRLLRQKDDGRTYDIAEAREGKIPQLSIESGEYDIPNHDTEELDGGNFTPVSGSRFAVDIRPKQPSPFLEEARRNRKSAGDQVTKKKRFRVSLKRSPSKKSSNSVKVAEVIKAEQPQQSEVVKEASKTVRTLSWLIHSAAGLLTRSRSSRPQSGVSDTTDMTFVSPKAMNTPAADDMYLPRRNSVGGDSYDLPFQGGQDEPLPEPNTLPKAASKVNLTRSEYGTKPNQIVFALVPKAFLPICITVWCMLSLS